VTFLGLFIAVESLLHINTFPPVHEKNSAAWVRLFHSVQDYPDTLDVVFYGTSRTQVGISPAAFNEQMEELGRKTKCWNLGILAIFDSGIKAHVENRKRADVVVIEQFGLQFSTPFIGYDRFEKVKAETRRYHVEDAIAYNLARSFMIFRENIIPSLFYKSFLKFETQGDGWTEVIFTGNQEVINTLKKNELDANIVSLDRIPIEEARLAQQNYMDLFNTILEQGSLLIIIRMPVGDKLKNWEDELLTESYHTDFLLNNKDILYIDANIHPELSKYQPVEYSHLNAADAVEFSRELAIIIDGWLKSRNL
jgi:hypothetical protein